MPALVTITPVDLQHLVATFDVQMSGPSVAGGANWTLSPLVAGPMQAVVTNATLRSNGQVVDLIVGPALTAGQTYTLTAVNAKTSAGAPLAGPNKVLNFVAPLINGDTSEFPGRVLEALTRATGEELQILSGRAVTQLVADFGEDDQVAFVETTLGFPSAGAIFIGDRKYTYTSKTYCSFNGCKKTREWDGSMVSVWTAVHFDVNSWVPEE